MSKEIHANTTLSHYRGWNDLSARQNQQQRSIHRHIATIHEIGESGDVTFIAMDFIDGLTLREKIHQAPTQLTKLLRHLNTSPKGRDWEVFRINVDTYGTPLCDDPRFAALVKRLNLPE